MFVVIAVVMTCHLRKAMNCTTFCQTADLLHGYDLAQRDAVKVHARCAGIVGRYFLILDDALNDERVRVRVGTALSSVFHLLTRGIGQGLRSGVHLFGAFARPIIDLCTQVCSAGNA